MGCMDAYPTTAVELRLEESGVDPRPVLALASVPSDWEWSDLQIVCSTLMAVVCQCDPDGFEQGLANLQEFAMKARVR